MSLSPDLIDRLRVRISSPARRSDDASAKAGAAPLPIAEVKERFEASSPGSGKGFDLMREKMAEWGFALDSMNFKDFGDGHMQAFSEDPNVPLAPPPGDAELDEAEATMRLEIPEEVRQLYRLADGGFGPGLGLPPLRGLVAGYQDVCRRGPDWTGEVEWPRHYLPIFSAVLRPSPIHRFDTAQNIAIDTVSGKLITFNEDWSEDGLTPDTAWSEVSPNLAAFLEDWLAG